MLKDATRPNKEQLRQRRANAITLRLGGASFAEIGAGLGISDSQAERDVKAALAESDADAAVDRERLRTVERARLMRLWRVWWPRAIGTMPDAQAAAVCLRVLKQLGVLDGTAAPIQVEHTGEVKVTDGDIDWNKLTDEQLRALIPLVQAIEAAQRAGPLLGGPRAP